MKKGSVIVSIISLGLVFGLWNSALQANDSAKSRVLKIPNPYTDLVFKNWGIFNTKALSHIQAPDAWKIEKGNKNVTVAVVDTGIDPNHRDLADNIWSDKTAGRNLSRSSEKVYGWNFVTNRANPFDDHGHGTHVAGIIGAISNPKTGISGVSPQISIMAVKYYSDSNSGAVNLSNTIKALHYAIDHGAQVINYSGGGPEFSEAEYQALKEAEAHNILVVAAAGNEHSDIGKDEFAYYPAAYVSYGLKNIISVASLDIHNNLLRSSNWGKQVHVAAPGQDIYSTLPGNRYGYMTGTSQATAFVTGIAALLIAKHQETEPNPRKALKPEEIIAIISQSVDHVKILEGKVKSEGKVNAYKALLALLNHGNPPQTAPEFLASQPVSLLNFISNPVALEPAQ